MIQTTLYYFTARQVLQVTGGIPIDPERARPTHAGELSIRPVNSAPFTDPEILWLVDEPGLSGTLAGDIPDTSNTLDRLDLSGCICTNFTHIGRRNETSYLRG